MPVAMQETHVNTNSGHCDTCGVEHKFRGPSKYDGTLCRSCGCRIKFGQLYNWAPRLPKGQRSSHACCANPDWTPANYTPAAESTPAEQDAPVTPAVSSPAVASKPASNGMFGMFADALAPYLESKLKTKVDEDTVLDLVSDTIESKFASALDNIIDTVKKSLTVRVEVKAVEQIEWKDVGVQHAQFPILLQTCAARNPDGSRINVWLKGAAGTGKTTAARKVAQALELKFYFTGAINEPYSLLGFMNANGQYVRTQFRDAWEHGGVFLFDEYDGSDPNATLPFNAALANGHCSFPDAVVERHANCIIIAAANTFGLGANDAYVGRLKLDAATLDRFVFIDWDIDENLERATCPNEKWVSRVQSIRAKVKSLGIRVLVTPRASYFGAALLAQGLPQAEVEKMVIRKAMTEEQWKQISGKTVSGK